MTPSLSPIEPHHAGSPSRVIQGFFPGGRPRIIQASPAPVAPVRPPVPAPVQPRPASPPAPLLPGRPATGALQPSPRPGQPPRPILPAKVQTGAMQPATPLRPQVPQPILPQRATPAAVQPHAGDAFPLPANFTLKPRDSGQPLPEPVQKKMESFFNASFADVRVHVGPEAPSIGALAFTHGTDLYFAPGQYNPQSSQGQQLLGHELTHVLQQRAGRVRNPLGSGVAVVQDPALEAEAERMGLRAASAALPIQANPAGIAPVVATLQAAGLWPNTIAAGGAILPGYSLAQGSVQRKQAPILPGKRLATGKTLPGTFPSTVQAGRPYAIVQCLLVKRLKNRNWVIMGPKEKTSSWKKWEPNGDKSDSSVVWANTAELTPYQLQVLIEEMSAEGSTATARELLDDAIKSGYVNDAQLILKGRDELRKHISLFIDLLLKSAESLASSDQQIAAPIMNAIIDEAKKLRKEADKLSSMLTGAVINAAVCGGMYNLRNEVSPAISYVVIMTNRLSQALLTGAVIDLKSLIPPPYLLDPGVVDLMNAKIRRFRHRKAYRPVTLGNQWKLEQVSSMVGVPDEETIRRLSTRNIELLWKRTGPLFSGQNGKEWMRLYQAIRDLKFTLKHATSGWYSIENTKAMQSLEGLKRLGIEHKKSGMSSEHNTSSLGNADFVFFRFDADDTPMKTRYGPTTIVLDIDALEECGWVSLHDQLSPLDRPQMRELKLPGSGKVVKTCEYLPEHVTTGMRSRWKKRYPASQQETLANFLDEVFYGPDIRNGLALSVILEISYLGPDFQERCFGLKKPSDIQTLISQLFRPEAKIPSSLNLNAIKPIVVHNPEGDGRYYPDGSIHPEAMAAGKAWDSCKRNRTIVESIIEGFHRAPSLETCKKVISSLKTYQKLVIEALALAEEFQKWEVKTGEKIILGPTGRPSYLKTAKSVVEERNKSLEALDLELQEWTDHLKQFTVLDPSSSLLSSSSIAEIKPVKLTTADRSLKVTTSTSTHGSNLGTNVSTPPLGIEWAVGEVVQWKGKFYKVKDSYNTGVGITYELMPL